MCHGIISYDVVYCYAIQCDMIGSSTVIYCSLVSCDMIMCCCYYMIVLHDI